MVVVVGPKPEVRLLGPLDLIVGGERVEITSVRQRRLLAALALHAGYSVPEDELMDRIWSTNGSYPENPRGALQTYVSRLRSCIGAEALVRRDAGYVLVTDVVDIDVTRFEASLSAAEERLAEGASTEAHALLVDALASVRGDMLGDIADDEWARPEAMRLEAQVQRARELLLQAAVDTREPSALSDLERFVERNPLREHSQELLARELYARGRHAEALRSIDRYRALLEDELGLAPGPALIELERQILLHDPGLSVASRPTTIAGYALGEMIAEGSFGAIYRAEQRSIGREVAIKVVKPELANDPEFVRRFEAEAQTIAKLEHPHIVPLYDFWRDHTGAYLVMRYIGGGTAEQRLVRDGPWSLVDVARLVNEVGAALTAAHHAGIVHRDVKPANILIDADGNAYLGDFGIATQVSATDRRDTAVAGSPLYVSPEQLQGGHGSVAGDVYALGVVVHELLSGRAPYGDSDSLEILLQRKVRERPPSILADRPDLPRAVDTVLRSATENDPAGRFSTIEDFVLAFRAAVGGALTGTASGDPASSRPRQMINRTLVSLEMANRQPYKGLAAFGEPDADDFFGRSDLVDELRAHLETSRMLVVTGPSGSGKSSVVRAGLVPRLRESGRFVASIIPGAHPMDEVETALQRISTQAPGPLAEHLHANERGLGNAVKRVLPENDAELVLVIDQFEELFTLAKPAERDHFLGALAWALCDSRSRLRVIATLRADFYDRPLQHPAISDLVRVNTIAVSPLTGADLEQAITQPAARVGVAMEPALVAELVAEVSGQPSSLPLLQYALTEMFDRRDQDEMTLDIYHRVGGIAGALANRADELVDVVGADREQDVRRLFSRLITLGEGTEDTRRRVLRSELGTISPEVIETYGEARLLTFDRNPATREPTVEIAHEALIREWPRLRSWLDEDRDGLRLMAHLGIAAAEWDEAGRPDSELYRGGRLEAAEEWARRRGEDLTELETTYLSTSAERRVAEEMEERLRLRRLRRLLVSVGIIALVAMVAGVLALQQRTLATARADDAQGAALQAERSATLAEQGESRARDAEAAADVRRLASEAGFRVQSDRQVGLLLALEAHRRDPSPVSIGALQRALTGLDNYLGTVESGIPYGFVEWLDEERIVVAGPLGVSVVDATSADVLVRRDAPALVFAVNPGDGALIAQTIASASGGHIALVPAGDRTAVRVLDIDTPAVSLDHLIAHEAEVDGVELSPDGTLVATIDQHDVLRMFDAETGELQWEVEAHPESVFADLGAPGDVRPNLFYTDPAGSGRFTSEKSHHHLRFTDDGRQLITQEGVLRRWDVRTGQRIGDDIMLWRHRPGLGDTKVMSAPLVSYLGDVVGDRAVLYDQASITVVDIDSGEVLSSVAVPDAGEAYGLAKIDSVRWSGGGDAWVLLTNGRLSHLRLDDGGVVDAPTDSQVDRAADLSISPSGRRAAITAASGIGIFSLDGSRAIARAVPRHGTHTGSVTPDGTIVTQDYGDGSEWFAPGEVYDLSESEPRIIDRPDALLLQHLGVMGPAFKDLTRHYGVRLRDLETLEPLGPEIDIPITWSGQAATADSRLLAAGTGSEGIGVFEVETGDLVARLDELGNSVASLSFSPDGERLAAAAGYGPAMVWETSGWTIVDRDLGGDTPVVSLRYSPDGRSLVTMDDQGDLAVRDPLTHEITSQLVGSGSPNVVDGLFFFSDDGRYLVTAADSSPRLWDLQEGVAIGDPFPNDADNKVGGADGLPRFVTAVGNHRLIWDLDVDSWPDVACHVVGRNLTEVEWQQFGPAGQPYQATCEQWPSGPELRGTEQRLLPVPDATTTTPGDTTLEELGDRAAAQARAVLESGDTVSAERICEDWAKRLGEASGDPEELAGSTVANADQHRFWTILQGVELCAGQTFDRALETLVVAIDSPEALCGGYPSPCAQPRS